MAKTFESIKNYLNRKIKSLKKIDVKEYINNNILFFIAVISLSFNGFLLRFVTVGNIYEIKPLIADVGVVLILCAFSYLVKPKKQIIYLLILSIFLTAVCVINSMYYTFYLSFTSVSLIATSLQIIDVGDALVQNVIEFKDFLFLWQPVVLLIVYFRLNKKGYYEKPEKFGNPKRKMIGTLIVATIILSIFASTLTGLEVGRLIKQWNREFLVAKFGVYFYQVNDIVRSLEPRINTLFGYDNAIRQVRTFYENRTSEQKKNKYTNIFEGKNIIMIHAESIQKFTMELDFDGREVTPNLNRLAKEGINFTNFYSQVSVGTSSDTEFTLSTSLLPVSNGTVAIGYWDREYVTIPKILKDKGYFTFSMHGNNGTFWNRIAMHDSFGYDKFFHKSHYDIDEVIGLGLSDKSFFRQSVEKIKDISSKEERYYATIITLTNHTPFDEVDKYGDFPVTMKVEIENEFGELEEIEAPYMEGTTLGNYFKAVRYADEAMGEFIDALDKEGLLENTVIVIYGDHDARLSRRDYVRFYNYDPYTDSVLSSSNPDYIPVDFYSYELNRKVPLVIWTKDKQFGVEIDTVMGMYDMLPTLGNMFGFSSPYALGQDIFSVEENVVVFPNGNWLTNKIYFNSQRNEYLALVDEPISKSYIEAYSLLSEEYMQVSNNFIIYDYLRRKKEIQDVREGAIP